MNTTLKETVKNIFASNKFEDALNLTRSLRGEYIAEFGIKSWNGLVSYYKSHEVIPATIVAEPETEMEMEPETDAPYFDEGFDEWDDENQTETPDDTVGNVPPVEENDPDDDEEPETETDVTTEDKQQEDSDEDDNEDNEVEYMLYRNTGDKVEWFGHCENFRNLKVGTTGRFIRMNNRGVSDGIVVATARMSLDHVNLFHRCYATIIRTKYSWKEQLQMAATVLSNIKEAVKDFNLVPQSDTKLVDHILNFNK